LDGRLAVRVLIDHAGCLDRSIASRFVWFTYKATAGVTSMAPPPHAVRATISADR